MSRSTISDVFAWEALDSRGTPTVACEVRLATGATGSCAVPSGASVGSFEAHELRDGDQRFGGRGVRRAVASVFEVLGPGVCGLDAGDQALVDARLRELDGTPELGRLGANAVLAVSVATALAAAADEDVPLWRRLVGDGPVLLPMPMINIVSGGAHAARAVDIQDVLVVPIGATSFAEAIEWSWRVRDGTSRVASDLGLPTALVADEGGLGVPLATSRDAVELVAKGIERADLQPGVQAAIAIDVAATQLWIEGRYRLSAESRELEATGLVDEISSWCDAYPIVSIEDPMAEDDWDGWQDASRRLGGRVQLVGDDLFVTDADRLDRGVALGVANAVLVKPNQAGTLSGAQSVVDRAQQAGYATIVSARSGETEDAWLADLAVGWTAGQIKVGSTTRSERTAKWNRLLRIEAELEGKATFARAGVLGRNG